MRIHTQQKKEGELKNIREEGDRDRWKEGCMCLWRWKDVLAQGLVRLQWLFCFSSQPGATGPIHFSQQKATHWRRNISLFTCLFCFLPFLSLSPFLLCVWLTQGWSAAPWQGRDASTLTPHTADGKGKSDALCQLADTLRWCSVLSIPPKKQMFLWLKTGHYVGDRGACWQRSGHSCGHSRAAQTSCISNCTWHKHCKCYFAARYDIIKVDSWEGNVLYSTLQVGAEAVMALQKRKSQGAASEMKMTRCTRDMR